MKQTLVLIALALAGSVSNAQEATAPIKKIISMLEAMKEKCKEEKSEEAVQFASFKSWCDAEKENTNTAITDAKDDINSLNADIDVLEVKGAKLSAELATLDQNLKEWTQDKSDSIATRTKEKADYDTLHQDYSESIIATTKAGQVLSAELASQVKNADALAMIEKAKLIPAESAKKITAFLQNYESGEKQMARLLWPTTTTPPATTGDINDLIDSLKTKFMDERTALEKDEEGKIAVFDKLSLDLAASIKSAESSIELKSVERSKALEEANTKKTELAETLATKKKDQAYLEEISQDCTQKATDYEAREKLRVEEIEAIGKGIEIISDLVTVEERQEEKRSRVLLQTKSQTSLFALRSSAKSPTIEKVADYLEKMSEQLSSSLLSTAAQRAEVDPFAKVKGMIEELIKNLEAQSKSSLTKQAWCKQEMTENKKSRSKTSMQIDHYNGEIDAANARVSKLDVDVTELKETLAKQAENFETASKERKAEKEENDVTIKDAKQAVDAVTIALKVLKDFYAKAEKAKSLIQEAKQKPEIFDEAYKGTQSKGVIGLLDMVYQDYKRLLDKATTDEATASKAFSELDKETQILKAQRENEVELKSKEISDLEHVVKVHFKVDLGTAEKELKAAEDYLKSLNDQCLEKMASHAEMEAQRKQELASLENALAMLAAEGE
eukprot:TRINITY_DN79928_c0_g1_i1.p1 TRINITY_DN79928_c0_g1~~TRINITY_DN79928_c0_g1_i1.p1  ORF type:complete len:672 (-),score=209.51 TRINITY_DN79928_c0_g1_i1:114-2129(-)